MSLLKKLRQKSEKEKIVIATVTSTVLLSFFIVIMFIYSEPINHKENFSNFENIFGALKASMDEPIENIYNESQKIKNLGSVFNTSTTSVSVSTTTDELATSTNMFVTTTPEFSNSTTTATTTEN